MRACVHMMCKGRATWVIGKGQSATKVRHKPCSFPDRAAHPTTECARVRGATTRLTRWTYVGLHKAVGLVVGGRDGLRLVGAQGLALGWGKGVEWGDKGWGDMSGRLERGVWLQEGNCSTSDGRRRADSAQYAGCEKRAAPRELAITHSLDPDSRSPGRSGCRTRQGHPGTPRSTLPAASS